MTDVSKQVMTTLISLLQQDVRVTNNDIMQTRIEKAGGVEPFATQMLEREFRTTRKTMIDVLMERDLGALGSGDQLQLPGLESSSLPRLIPTDDAVIPVFQATLPQIDAYVEQLDRRVRRQGRIVDGYKSTVEHLHKMAQTADLDITWHTLGDIVEQPSALTSGE